MKRNEAIHGLGHRLHALGRATTLIMGFVLGNPAPSLHGAELTASGGLDQLRLLTKQSFGLWTVEGQHERFVKFRSLLEDIARVNTNGLTLGWQENVIIQLAHDVTNHWDRLDELLTTYGVPRDRFPAPRVILPPPLKSTHANEAYRPAWEALILAPETAEIRFMQSLSLITDALARIGNTNSLPILELAFAMTCQEGVERGHVLEKQFRILKSLNYFTRPESLAVLLRCLSYLEAAHPNDAAKYEGYDLHEWVFRFLTDKDHYGTGEKWRDVLRSFPKENLPPKQRDILDRATDQ